jgi:hypothetical protein
MVAIGFVVGIFLPASIDRELQSALRIAIIRLRARREPVADTEMSGRPY